MFKTVIKIFIGFNAASAAFNAFWFLVALNVYGINTVSAIFGLASIAHCYFIVLAIDKLKSLDQSKEK